jgi:Htaa
MRLPRPRWLAALATAAIAAIALLSLAPGAQATNTATEADVLLYRGATTVQLDPAAAGALGSLGVSVAPTGRAYAGARGISFPITFGVVDAQTLAGQIRHAGGLVLSKDDTKVYLTRYFIDTETATLSGLVNTAKTGGDRADLFDLDLSGLDVRTKGSRITLSGVTLKLTAGAAAALNGAFGAGASPFTEGLVLGTATIRARTWTIPTLPRGW